MKKNMLKSLIVFSVLLLVLPQNITFAESKQSEESSSNLLKIDNQLSETMGDDEAEENDNVNDSKGPIESDPSSDSSEKIEDEEYQEQNSNEPESEDIEKELDQNSKNNEINSSENEPSNNLQNQKVNIPKYSIGDEGGHVRDLKKDLTELGFGNFPADPSNRYGKVTANVVKDFQKTFGLEVTGEVNSKTLDEITGALLSDYRIGKKGSHVRDLKLDLSQLGFGSFPRNPSKNYGTVTANVVKEFQTYHGLLVTGIADVTTREKVEEILNEPYENGDEGLHIVQLKKDLTELGFGNFPANPSNRYGSITANVVRDFQKTFGLKVTGKANPVTLNTIAEALSSDYRDGKRGPHVRELKKELTQLGFGNFPRNPSLNYGTVTANVIKDFQRQYKLPMTGIVDDNTRNKMKEILNPPYKNGHQGLHISQLKKDLRELGFGNFPRNPSISYGSITARVVEDFQNTFGLKVTGTVDEKTLDQLNEILSSNYRKGKSGSHVRDLKRNLSQLGFGNFPKRPSTSYGSVTVGVVKDFQRQYNLQPTGVADATTRKKIKEILNPPYKNGHQGLHISQLKRDLKALGFGNFPSNPSITYGSVTARVVKQFQETYALKATGNADKDTLRKISELKKGLNYINYDYSLQEAVEFQMGQMAQTDKKEYAWVSKNYIDSNNKVTATSLRVRTQPTTQDVMSNKVLGTLSKGTKVDIIDQKGNWYAIKYNNNAWVHAVEKDVRYYLNPNNFINDQRQRFQFLDLSKPSGASRSVLNNYLKGKGVLSGQGKAFIDAARLQGVNDIYLISHSILETGHGTSTLAKGVEVGVNSSGKPVRVTKSNRKSLKNIKKVYNVYGIGAVDSNPLNGGAIRAYEEGWDTVAKAIKGGAAFIGGDYIKAGQNTLYKMRWNPDLHWKQYASDIGWASKQVNTMYNLYKEIGFDTPLLDIPVYK